ncbi:MAG: alpha/beta hydrolase [Clostridia bacterium]|nr:alpha/beta hydrolase [Clostridia bacterium]
MPIANVNGIKLFYDTYGNGEPVVFIHGVAITSRVWDYQKDFISRYYRMIVLDLRGSGRSDKTPAITHTAELLADDLKGLVDYLGYEKVNIVGLSIGAAVAMKFAIKYPHMVSRLILTGAFTDLDGILNFVRKHFAYLVGRMLMTRLFGGLAVKIMLPSASKDELLYYHKNIIKVDKEEIIKYDQILGSYSITPALGRIQAATLLMYGQYEWMLHKYGRLIKGLVKNSQMIIVPGVGHGWNGEKSELFSQYVLKFIKEGTI